jgi:hypothetical protein
MPAAKDTLKRELQRSQSPCSWGRGLAT